MNNVLFNKIERLKEELCYLKKNSAKIIKEIQTSPEIKKAAERSVYLCAEITLDIAELILNDRKLPRPLSYSDTIQKLGEHDIIPREFARDFVYIAGLRNFLAHDYQKDTTARLLDFFKEGISDMEKFLSFIG